jgi:integrase
VSRAPLPLGTWGKIRTYPVATDARGRTSRHRAIAKYRDYDGVTRQVEATAPTQAKAENRLRAKLRARTTAARAGELTARDRFGKAADMYLARVRGMVDEGRRSPGTVENYERALTNHVRPALAELRLIEVRTPVVDKFIGKIKTEVGAPTAKTCRTLVSGVMGMAVRYGAVDVNPVREVERIEAQPKRLSRAFTPDEWINWLTQLRADEKAVERDLPDLSLFMMGTGARIGEALAVLGGQVDVDAAEVEITHTIIRVKGRGLIRKRTKSRAGERRLKLPDSIVTMLRARLDAGLPLDGPLFPNTLGGFRDPNNTRRELREARGDGLLSWVTSHNFRKSVATILDDAGHSGRQVADQIGHSQVSMAQNFYLARKVANPQAAEDIELFLSQPSKRTRPTTKKDG